MSAMQARVLGYLIGCGNAGSTDEEGEKALGIKLRTYSPRRGELVDYGLVTNSGRRRRTDAGRSAAVWVAVRGASLG